MDGMRFKLLRSVSSELEVHPGVSARAAQGIGAFRLHDLPECGIIGPGKNGVGRMDVQAVPVRVHVYGNAPGVHGRGLAADDRAVVEAAAVQVQAHFPDLLHAVMVQRRLENAGEGFRNHLVAAHGGNGSLRFPGNAHHIGQPDIRQGPFVSRTAEHGIP